MDDNKSFWEQLAALAAGVYTNTVNAQEATEQEQARAAQVAGVVRFGLVIAAIYFGGKLLVSLFKR